MGDDVFTMFKSQGAKDLGLDDKSAAAIVANMDATTLPMCVGGTDLATIDTDEITILMFGIDKSLSMSPVESLLITEFNDILLPGLRGASQGTRQSLLVGGIAFNENIDPMWNGKFWSLDDIKPLTQSDYRASGRATALHAAQNRMFAEAALCAANTIQVTNTPPKTILVVLSDGANNCPPHDPAAVKINADKLSRELFVLAFAGFQTYEPVDFHEIARETGFEAVFETKATSGESSADRQRRFRHLIGTLSSSIIRQSQTQITPASSQTFWQAP